MSTPPETLYIYCTPTTAKNILKGCALPYVAPAYLNDPFSPANNPALSFDKDALLKACVKLAVAMIFAPTAPTGDSPIINAVVRWRSEQRFSAAEEAEPVLRELLSRMVDHRMSQIDKLVTEWSNFTQSARLLSAFTTVDNLYNWQNYGDNHKGLILGFRTDESMVLSEAKQADYGVARPEVTSIKEQVNILLQYQKDNASSRFQELLCSRPVYRKAEQEWVSIRESKKPSAGSNPGEEQVPFQKEELKQVHFGMAMEPKLQSALLAFIKKEFSGVKCYQSSLTKGKYELTKQAL